MLRMEGSLYKIVLEWKEFGEGMKCYVDSSGKPQTESHSMLHVCDARKQKSWRNEGQRFPTMLIGNKKLSLDALVLI